MLPISNIVCKILIHAAAYGIDIENLGPHVLMPAGTSFRTLCHVAHGNHVAPVYRPEWR